MRFFLSVILIALLSFIAGLFLPWWSIAIVSFLVLLLIPQTTGYNFLAGFLGVFLVWAVVAGWIDIKNNSILSHRVAQLFSLGGSAILLLIVTAFIGGLVGGLAAVSGGSLRKAVHPNKKLVPKS